MNKKVKPGDIIIFNGGDNWISKTICWLTKSKVSHSAMVYDKDTIVEMGSKGIVVSKFNIDIGNDAHVMRLNPEKPIQPLIKAAKVYVDQKVEYDFPVLVLLAGLIIYREVRPTQRLRKITDLVLTGACLALDKLLNKLTHKGTTVKSMVCSQLVYQIYLDCGKEYTLKIQDLLDYSNQQRTKGFICIADSLENESLFSNDEDILPNIMESSIVGSSVNQKDEFDRYCVEGEYDIDEICHELYDALLESEKVTNVPTKFQVARISNNFGNISKKSIEFVDRLNKLLEKTHIDIPLPALFITPEDIYTRATNLKNICDCKITRI